LAIALEGKPKPGNVLNFMTSRSGGNNWPRGKRETGRGFHGLRLVKEGVGFSASKSGQKREESEDFCVRKKWGGGVQETGANYVRSTGLVNRECFVRRGSLVTEGEKSRKEQETAQQHRLHPRRQKTAASVTGRAEDLERGTEKIT